MSITPIKDKNTTSVVIPEASSALNDPALISTRALLPFENHDLDIVAPPAGGQTLLQRIRNGVARATPSPQDVADQEIEMEHRFNTAALRRTPPSSPFR